MTATIVASALDDFRSYFEQFPDVATNAAVMAVNQVAEREGLAIMVDNVSEQVRFPKGYVKARMKVTRKARRGSIEAVITGRDRATSLARFTGGVSIAASRGKPLRVEIQPGKPQTLKKAFLVKLRGGNTGLAVRLGKGQELRNSEKAVKLGNNLYLLYGPSIDQVAKGVADEYAPDIINRVGVEFLRQFARLSNGN